MTSSDPYVTMSDLAELLAAALVRSGLRGDPLDRCLDDVASALDTNDAALMQRAYLEMASWDERHGRALPAQPVVSEPVRAQTAPLPNDVHERVNVIVGRLRSIIEDPPSGEAATNDPGRH
jgi:hypothetical protein